MRETLLSGWNFLRIVRLVLGLALVIQAIQQQFWAAGLLGGLLVFQSLSNTGCCGPSGCRVPPARINKKNNNSVDPIEYKEVE